MGGGGDCREQMRGNTQKFFHVSLSGSEFFAGLRFKEALAHHFSVRLVIALRLYRYPVPVMNLKANRERQSLTSFRGLAFAFWTTFGLLFFTFFLTIVIHWKASHNTISVLLCTSTLLTLFLDLFLFLVSFEAVSAHHFFLLWCACIFLYFLNDFSFFVFFMLMVGKFVLLWVVLILFSWFFFDMLQSSS